MAVRGRSMLRSPETGTRESLEIAGAVEAHIRAKVAIHLYFVNISGDVEPQFGA